MRGTCIEINDNPRYGRDMKSETVCTAALNCFDYLPQNNGWTIREIRTKLYAAETNRELEEMSKGKKYSKMDKGAKDKLVRSPKENGGL